MARSRRVTTSFRTVLKHVKRPALIQCQAEQPMNIRAHGFQLPQTCYGMLHVMDIHTHHHIYTGVTVVMNRPHLSVARLNESVARPDDGVATLFCSVDLLQTNFISACGNLPCRGTNCLMPPFPLRGTWGGEKQASTNSPSPFHFPRSKEFYFTPLYLYM